jgi:hypothetical protein
MEENTVVLYLESWQRNMVGDFASTKKKNITKLIVDIAKFKPSGCLRSYLIPPDGMRKGDWLLYLTDAQSQRIKEQMKLRTAVPSINITEAAVKAGIIALV